MYLVSGSPWLLVVHQFLPALNSSYRALVVNCNIDQLPPPGSEVGTYDSCVIIKLWLTLPLPQANAHKFPFTWHFLIVCGCHCFSLIFGSFLLYLRKKRRLLTHRLRRNPLRRVGLNLLRRNHLFLLQRRFGYQRLL